MLARAGRDAAEESESSQQEKGVSCRLLKERQGSSALVRFERALMLAKYLGDLCQERRATRGLAAAARLQVSHKLLCTPCMARMYRCIVKGGVQSYLQSADLQS